MSHHYQEDGWDNRDHEDERVTIELPSHLRYHHKEVARDILDASNHSLQPDMVFGWRPKLPSCPLPLTYHNPYVQALLAHLPSDDRFKLVFLGPRPSNSVQLNQQYDYIWRYRSRYGSNIGAVRQAVKRVGDGGRRIFMDVNPGEPHFESNFESGNLDMAVKIKKNEYDLFLRSDTNTRGHTSWYYFKVNNHEQLGDIQFNVCNFGKKKNLYAGGLKPYCLVEGSEWKQEGTFDVNWVQRICRYGFDRKAFQLQFKYHFREKNQQVYFAYAIPYTYSRLQHFIADMSLRHGRFIKLSKLCETLGGLDIPMLTITNGPEGEENTDDNMTMTEVRKKKVVLITGRIHPGETHSSFIVEGFIKSLLSDEATSKALRSSFIFYIIPMLNPDGVVAGNFRTSFSGKDLNRQFNKLNKYVFPQVTALCDFALELKRAQRSAFQFYFDFHAHSSKKGLFCYGPQHTMGKPEFFRARALAKLIQQKTPIFSYRKSIFTISEHKRATGRAHMLLKIKIPMTFTFQVSNGLYETKQSKINPFKIQTLIDLGHAVLLGLHRYGQLEMRLPSLNAKAKVDTGIKKRIGLSVKQFRRSVGKKARTISIKETNMRDISNTHSLRQKNQVSLQNIIQDQINKQKSQENTEDKQEFMRIMQEITKEESEEKVTEDYEGGSDSQSDGEDLEDEELDKLHKIIETRNDNPKSYSKGSLNWKVQARKDLIRRQSQSQQIKQIINEVQMPKKPVTSKYLQPLRALILPPRSKRPPLLQAQKAVLPPKNFALQI